MACKSVNLCAEFKVGIEGYIHADHERDQSGRVDTGGDQWMSLQQEEEGNDDKEMIRNCCTMLEEKREERREMT